MYRGREVVYNIIGGIIMNGQKIKDLLAKYINHVEKFVCHVVEQEGTDYGWSLSEFNDKEIKTLIELGAELLGEGRCPVCGRERDSETANKLAQCICQEYGMMNTHQNPGGRVLQFPFGACRVYDMCNWCDYDVIKKFCEESLK